MESGEGGPDEKDRGGAGRGATVPSFLRCLYSAASGKAQHDVHHTSERMRRELSSAEGRCTSDEDRHVGVIIVPVGKLSDLLFNLLEELLVSNADPA
jgi:hypothetical protein